MWPPTSSTCTSTPSTRLLDGYSQVKELAKYAAQARHVRRSPSPTTATCTARSTSTRPAKDAGVKPIIGVETYVAPGQHDRRRPAQDRDYRHLILLAKNETGYRNLLKLITRAWLEGYYYKPRIDRDLLAEQHDGPDRALGLPRRRGGRPDPRRRLRRAAKQTPPGTRSVFGDRLLTRDPGARPEGGRRRQRRS